jgi:putative PIN family toxin of toxin-antitoxin system
VRLVLDTNAAVSGLLWQGNPGKLLDAAQAGSLTLYASALLLAELHGVLGREKFAEHLEVRGLSATQIFEGYAALTTVVVPLIIPPAVIDDPDDDTVLACAVAAKADLRALLEKRQVEHERVRRLGHITPLVFFRMVAKGRGGEKQPKPIKAFAKAWRQVCTRAGLPGRIPHDLRRSAVRNFVRAGISEHIAMKLSGHLTSSVFRRYDIVSESDLRYAANALDLAREDGSQGYNQTARLETARARGVVRPNRRRKHALC